MISCDDLEVSREEDVFNAIIKWVQSDASRKCRLHFILAHCRLPLVSPYFLYDSVEKNPLVKSSQESMTLVEEAKLFHLLPDRRPDFDHCARFTPRRNAGTAQVIVSVGGEDDKVVLRSVEYWDPCNNIWKQLACLPFAVRYSLVNLVVAKFYYAISCAIIQLLNVPGSLKFNLPLFRRPQFAIRKTRETFCHHQML